MLEELQLDSWKFNKVNSGRGTKNVMHLRIVNLKLMILQLLKEIKWELLFFGKLFQSILQENYRRQQYLCNDILFEAGVLLSKNNYSHSFFLEI